MIGVAVVIISIAAIVIADAVGKNAADMYDHMADEVKKDDECGDDLEKA